MLAIVIHFGCISAINPLSLPLSFIPIELLVLNVFIALDGYIIHYKGLQVKISLFLCWTCKRHITETCQVMQHNLGGYRLFANAPLCNAMHIWARV